MARDARRRKQRTTAGRIVVLVLLLAGATACGPGRAVESKALVPRDPGTLAGTKWILVATGNSEPVPRSTPFTLDIADRTASGTGPCNRFHLSFTQDGQDIRTGPVASTQVACAPALLAAEHSFFASLESVDTAQKEDTNDELVLTGPHDVRLVFDRAKRSADRLAGRWDIVNYARPDALTTPVPGTRPTLDFGDNHALTIETGCNTGHATWTASGHSLALTAPRATLKACAVPPGVEAQESAIFAALPRVRTVELARIDAVLLAADGSALFVLEPHT
jgi:heat shock protein HslJ